MIAAEGELTGGKEVVYKVLPGIDSRKMATVDPDSAPVGSFR
jgi:hypothetical protein